MIRIKQLNYEIRFFHNFSCIIFLNFSLFNLIPFTLLSKCGPNTPNQSRGKRVFTSLALIKSIQT